jgi:nucleotide-binding universal stress UspA family protein
MMITDSSRDQRVVVGVDASHHASHAADWAAREAEQRGMPLHVIHALDADPSSALSGPGAYSTHVHAVTEASEQLLAEVKYRIQSVHPSLDVTTELVHQAAAGALVLASHQAELLVVGTRGRGGFAGLPLGSVSARVVAHAHCPVVVLRDHDQRNASVGEVVLGMQENQAEETILFAFEQAARTGAGLRALHAWAPYPGNSRDYLSDTDVLARQAAERMVAELAPLREKFPSVRVTISVERGHPAAVLAGASAEARLVVVGAHRHLGPLSLGVGPVIHGLLSHAYSPVAVVPVPKSV